MYLDFFAFASIVAGGIMFPECSCVRSKTLLAPYLEYLLTEFDQTFITNGLWDKDERIKFWG